MGINTGILTNATPLSPAHIKELEREVLENGKTFAYLDENSQLCFMSTGTPEAIKELAWNNAYKLTAGQDGLVRAEYKKDSLKTYFLDKVSTKGSLDGTWLADDALEGSGAEYYTSAPSTLSFRSTAPLNEFQEVQVNGQTVDPSNYTLEEGSTVVKLSIDYLKTLNEGNYDIAIVSDSKTVTGDFTVAAPKLNEYGFYYNIPYVLEDPEDATNNFFVRFTDECTPENLGTYMFMQGFNQEESRFESIAFYYVQDGIIYAYDPNSGEIIPLCEILSEGAIKADGVTLNPSSMPNIRTDESYLYVFDEAIDGYVVSELRPAPVAYGPVKSNILNKPVKAISKEAFFLSGLCGADFTNFKLPEGLLSIGESALSWCKLPATFSIPSSVRVIGRSAFNESLTNVKSLRVPHGIKRLEDNTFGSESGSYRTLTLILPNTLEYIGSYAVMCNTIIFEGTMDQWNAIEKHEFWWLGDCGTYVQCSDGQVAL